MPSNCWIPKRSFCFACRPWTCQTKERLQTEVSSRSNLPRVPVILHSKHLFWPDWHIPPRTKTPKKSVQLQLLWSWASLKVDPFISEIAQHFFLSWNYPSQRKPGDQTRLSPVNKYPGDFYFYFPVRCLTCEYIFKPVVVSNSVIRPKSYESILVSEFVFSKLSISYMLSRVF